jgi:hypothetical protein
VRWLDLCASFRGELEIQGRLVYCGAGIYGEELNGFAQEFFKKQIN